MGKVLTTGALAKAFQVAPRTVAKWFDSGRLRGYRIPGSEDRRVPLENALDFARANGMPTDRLVAHDTGVVLLTPDEGLAGRLRPLLPADWEIATSPRLVGAGVLLARRRWSGVVLDGDLGSAIHEVLAHLPALQPDVPCGVLASEDGSTALSVAERERLCWVLGRPLDLNFLAQKVKQLLRPVGNGTNGHRRKE